MANIIVTAEFDLMSSSESNNAAGEELNVAAGTSRELEIRGIPVNCVAG